jgi:WD40 repeat protein
LAVASKSIIVSSAENLYVLSKSKGHLIAEIATDNSHIQSIRFSPELKIVATAGVNDRFINVFSMNEKVISRLGSLMCSHDVSTFSIHNDALLAVTDVGTLEVFWEFNSNFEPEKKGGLTKSPSIEISLRSSNPSNVQIQDVIQKDDETIIMWSEGGNTSFKSIELGSKSGAVIIDVDEEQAVPEVCSK